MKKFFVCTCFRDCTRRNLDSQRIFNYLVKNNWTFTRKIRFADLIIVSTCGFCKITEESSLNMVKNFIRKKSKSSKLIIIGCLPKINPRKLKKLGNFITFSPRELDGFDELINPKIRLKNIPDPNIISYVSDLLGGTKGGNEINPDNTYIIRITEGCLGNCSYCAIKFAIGKLKSKPLAEVIKEFKEGLNKGYKQFKITGGDTGCYGVDTGTTIPYLLRRICTIKGDYKLAILNFNPQWLIKYHNELLPIFLKHYNKISYILMPLQSGSNRILKFMRRPYDIEDVKIKLRDLKKKVPQLKIATDMMVGFPGETIEDFDKSKKLLEEGYFSLALIYKYTDRSNTKSSEIRDKITEKIINMRFRELSNLTKSYSVSSLNKKSLNYSLLQKVD